jgi:hypothetical protein
VAHRVAIHGDRRHLVVHLEPVLDFARDCLEVRLGGAAANHEEIREARNAAQVQGNEIFGLFIGSQFRAARSQFCAGQDEGVPR